VSPTKSTCLDPAGERNRVLLVAHRDDIHVRAVAHRLAIVSGMEGSPVVFDTATFPMASDLSMDSECTGLLGVHLPLPDVYGESVRPILRGAGVETRAPVRLDRLRALYWRRPRACLIDDALEHPDLRRYAAKSSWETLEGLVEQLAFQVRVIDLPGAVNRARLKVLQLELARQAGMALPRTLITNSPADAAAFVGAIRSSGSEVISKSPADPHDFPAKTELVDDRRAGLLDRVRLSPVILQQRIAGGPDLRIVVVGERLFGMAQTAGDGFDGVDCRLDPAPRRAPFEPAAALRLPILAMQRRLGLSFGVYDFKSDAAGTPFFLEVNPVGQWLPVECAGRQPVAEALALYLWHGAGAEWRTRLPPLQVEDLDSLQVVFREGVPA
jgi:hypothetical protein